MAGIVELFQSLIRFVTEGALLKLLLGGFALWVVASRLEFVLRYCFPKVASVRIEIVSAVLPLALLAGRALWSDHRVQAQHSLPPGVDTLAAFAVTAPPVKEVAIYKSATTSFVEVVGVRPQTYLLIASGSPVYLFDAQGKLVVWTRDSGDCGDCWQEWQKQYALTERTVVSMQDALQRVAHKTL